MPRVLGADEEGREVLSHLAGQTIGDARPWPAWAHSDAALVAAGRWLSEFHAASATFSPPPGARWSGDHDDLRPGEIIGHHDAAPDSAVWNPGVQEESEGVGEPRPAEGGGRLVGVIDWDLAGPGTPLRDLAFTALTWVPLTTREVAAADGFPARSDSDVLSERARRLRLLLEAYGWDSGLEGDLVAVRQRAVEHAAGLRQAAAGGHAAAVSLVDEGVADAYEQAAIELDRDWPGLLSEGPHQPL